MRSLCPSRAFRFTIVLCAVLLNGLALSGTQALATGGEAPKIDSVSATDITEHSATLEAQINPEGLETRYEFWIEFANCQTGSCGSTSVGSVGQGYIAVDSTYQTVRVGLSDPQPNYSFTYWVLAVNSAGWSRASGEFKAVGSETDSTGGSPLPSPENKVTPFENQVESWVGKAAGEGAARELANAQREREAREAANRPPAPIPTPHAEWCGEEGVACGSEITVASMSIAVQSEGIALVKLTCKGKENCSGKLTVLTKTTARAKDRKTRSRRVTIGAAMFVVVAGKTITVKVRLDTQGRHLLDAYRGRLTASLEILKSEPAPEQTQTASIHLIRQTYRGSAVR